MMGRRQFATLALSAAASLPLLSELPSQADTGSARDYDFTEITKLIDSWISKGYYPGCSLIVVKDDKTVYERYFGTYKHDSVAYIASAGKWLAAATVATVVDAGKLSWDDPIAKWLPEFTDIKGKATLRQLFSHTSGFPDYQPKENHPDNYQTTSESVAHIVPLAPAFPPGAQFLYGGLAMQVGGRMAELATGLDWESLFQKQMAKPLRMTSTHFTPVDPGHIPMIAGGARSTLPDYANFLNMISHDGVFEGRRVLSESAIREMQADQVGKATVIPDEFVEHARGLKHTGIYGLSEWREILDGNGNAVQLSSPSWAGAYPWIDKTRNIYGFFLAHVDGGGSAHRDGFNSFYGSPAIVAMVAKAIGMGDSR